MEKLKQSIKKYFFVITTILLLILSMSLFSEKQDLKWDRSYTVTVVPDVELVNNLSFNSISLRLFFPSKICTISLEVKCIQCEYKTPKRFAINLKNGCKSASVCSEVSTLHVNTHPIF